MKRALVIGITMVALGAGAMLKAQSPRSAEVQMKAAQQKAEVEGDLKGAIEVYKKVIVAAGSNRALAAEALVRIAECYQKLGDTEAQKIYERIVREFSDQKEHVTLARARLRGVEQAALDVGITLRKVWDGDTSGTISQDGSRLSYNDWTAGHVGVRNVADGTVRPVTVSDYNAFQSVISRDGTQVAYGWGNPDTHRIELRITSSQGSRVTPSRRLFASDDVNDITPMDWSPDGKMIAVGLRRADQTAQIGLVTVPEGSLRVLKSVDWRGPGRVFFSPDARELGYDLPVSDTSDQRDVFVLAVDGSREVPAVVHRSQDVMMGWSPDGERLLFASDRQNGSMGLWALPIAAGKPRGLPELVKSNIGTGWSLGVSRTGALYIGTRAGDGDVAILSIDLTTGKPLGSATRPIQTFIGSNSQPDWSSDGKRLAYVSSRGFNPISNSDRIIAIQTLETGNVQELRPRLSYFNQINWSPDGRSFLTGGTDLKGRSGVFRIDSATGEVVAVVMTERGNNSYPQWSPDGTRIYYRHLLPGGSEYGVRERDLATGREREVVGGGFGLGPINVSPDGRWIVLEKTVGPAAAITLIPVEGGEPREMLRVAQLERFARYQGMPWTPDGRGFLVRKRLPKSAELWFVPLAGEPRKLDVDATAWSNGPVGALSLHPDGRQLAFLLRSREPSTQVWVLENFLPAQTPKR